MLLLVLFWRWVGRWPDGWVANSLSLERVNCGSLEFVEHNSCVGQELNLGTNVREFPAMPILCCVNLIIAPDGSAWTSKLAWCLAGFQMSGASLQ